jgi:hypothetical protein
MNVAKRCPVSQGRKRSAKNEGAFRKEKAAVPVAREIAKTHDKLQTGTAN